MVCESIRVRERVRDSLISYVVLCVFVCVLCACAGLQKDPIMCGLVTPLNVVRAPACVRVCVV